ncbi:hypothetical protein VitviT2T_026455 [Vitis vinifera]|uniref:Uncharacterized protein n=1 Tax=Vitis vinifera TaxID=29760 RepID=A0ABY9DQ72_VITVI|nr:hypothetical protein VitviT2T_026455 [Vitis vinifera]
MDGEGFKCGLESPLIPRDENGVGFGGESTKKCCDKSEAMAELKQQMKLVGPLVMESLVLASWYKASSTLLCLLHYYFDSFV